MPILITVLMLFTVIGLFFYIKFFKERKKLQLNLEDVTTISFDLTGSAEQVNTVSTDLLSSSKEQLDTLNSTVSASHEINSMIMRTSDNAKELSENAVLLQSMANDGQKIIQNMVTSSLEIKKGSEHFKIEMHESINELSTALLVIKEIADKTKLIDEIVFQTKLLSFNASVEAARAGEHGKGFAVVAEEIGKLAQVSGKSSLEISEIVTRSLSSVNLALQKTIKKVEDLTVTTASKSDAGYVEAINCESIFKSINGKISEINIMMKEISTAANEQSIGVEQLNYSITNLQEVADRNRLVASQSTEHANSFAAQTKELIKLTENMKFLLPKDKNKKIKLQHFIWNEKYMLGVNDMDDEHKVLVGKINFLVDNLETQYENINKTSLMAAFKDLASYTAEHFAHEEKFIFSINYPQASSHKKIHDKLLAQVGKYGQDIENGTLDDHKLISFLRNWLISHIMGIDMQYAAHYKEDIAS